MNRSPLHRFILTIPAALALLACTSRLRAQETVSAKQFAADVTQFLQTEIIAHVSAVTNLDPPQKIVLGVPTAGDFTWGSFMRAITEVSALTGQTNISGHDVPQFLGKLGLIESRLGGKTFSQLGAALALRRFGLDLKTNALWQSLSPSEQTEWRALLNPERFYDLKTHHVINLPENYMGVASRIAVYDYQMGLMPDRAFADDILTRAAGQFLHGALYTDDNLPTGRYDRYSQEYARFIYDASHNLGRADVQTAVEPALKTVMPTWYGLVSPEGYGYPWGRTIGDMSYLDSMEIVGFLAEHPEFRPAPLADLASVYYAAWKSLLRDYQTDRHLLNIFGPGRANYHYMTPERQWQQTTGLFFKAADSLKKLMAALQAENISSFPTKPNLPNISRFDYFRKGDRMAGVWLFRSKENNGLRFTLPFTTGTRPGIADYLPAPHGLPGFAAPVEQVLPVFTPFLELEDGRTIAACDGADKIEPIMSIPLSSFGHTFSSLEAIRAQWSRWAIIHPEKTDADLPFGKTEEFVEPGFETRVDWGANRRTEFITASRPVNIRRWSMVFPSTADHVVTRTENGHKIYRFTGREGTLEFSAVMLEFPPTEALRTNRDNVREIPLTETLHTNDINTALGKGTRGPIPLMLTLETTNIALKPHAPLELDISFREVPGK
jgi:hypothetical protein